LYLNEVANGLTMSEKRVAQAFDSKVALKIADVISIRFLYKS